MTGELPRTGSNLETLLLFGGLLTLAGGLLARGYR